MKKVFLILPLMAGLLFGGLEYDDSFDKEELDKLSVEVLLNTMEQSLANKIPMKLDGVTTLIKIVGAGKSLIYMKQVDTSDPKIHDFFTTTEKTQQLKVTLFKTDSNIACSVPAMRYMIDERGVSVVYKWVGKDAKPLFQYSVNKNDCAKLK